MKYFTVKTPEGFLCEDVTTKQLEQLGAIAPPDTSARESGYPWYDVLYDRSTYAASSFIEEEVDDEDWADYLQPGWTGFSAC